MQLLYSYNYAAYGSLIDIH
uniref:Uncharacterized protein n=1 Tax=Arundo donax TaxID=35708 RepID=A0A0A9AEU2_ARUDO